MFSIQLQYELPDSGKNKKLFDQGFVKVLSHRLVENGILSITMVVLP